MLDIESAPLFERLVQRVFHRVCVRFTVSGKQVGGGETVELGGSLTLADTSSITGGQVTNKGTLNLQGTTASLNSGTLANTNIYNLNGGVLNAHAHPVG